MTTKSKSPFDSLLQELDGMEEDLQKSMPADGEDGADGDDDKIAAAAEDGNADADGDGEDDVNTDGDDDGDDNDGDDGRMAKSFTLKLDDGSEVEAVDGTELVKALMARVETNEGQMTKALQSAVNLIKSQGDLIKSLQGQVAKLGDSGRGRKTLLTVTEKKPVSELRKSEGSEGDEGMTANEFMAKALSAQAAGRITGSDVAVAESYLNRGLAVPDRIVNRVIEK